MPLEEMVRKIFLILVLLVCPAASRAASPEDYYNAGMDLFKNHDYEKAVQYFHAAVEQRPDYWQAYQFLGESYYQSANRTEALVAMEESLRLHHDNPGLKKFVSKIKANSPWAPRWGLSDILSILAIFLSLFTLGRTFYRPNRFFPKAKNNGLQP